MAHRVVQVSYRWVKTAPVADKVAVEIGKVSDDWLRLNVHVWFLWTTKSPAEIYNVLRTSITTDDGVVVANLDHDTFAHGWAPQFVWDWLNEKMGWAKLGL